MNHLLDKAKVKRDRKAVRDTSDYICNKLNSDGFHVLRYDSPYSTYIKVDGGICHSIRVSNHKSPKGHLSYRYNVLVDCLDNDYVSTDKKYKKYYARHTSVVKIIDLIKQNRESSISKYGKLNYYSYVLESLKDNESAEKGFWHKANTVKTTIHFKTKYTQGISYDSLYKKVKRLKKQNK